MKEEKIDTIQEYIEGLNRELIQSLDMFENCERILSVVCILEGLIHECEHDIYRKDVLHCCNIISRLGDS
jgi:intergrase/recombinase